MTDWKLKDEVFKQILSRNNDPENELVSVSNTKKELIPHLKANPCWVRLPKGVLHSIERATTFHSLNRAIGLLYDYADQYKIWLGFM